MHGAARGADTLCHRWAEVQKDVTISSHPAKWGSDLGIRAGVVRNQEMLDKNPDINIVVAFQGGKGTADMVKKAEKKGLTILYPDGNIELPQKTLEDTLVEENTPKRTRRKAN